MALTYALISIYNLVLGLVGLGLVNYGLGFGLGGSGLDSITEKTYTFVQASVTLNINV